MNCSQTGMKERVIKNDIEMAISDIDARLNYEKIIKNFKTFSNNPEKINQQ